MLNALPGELHLPKGKGLSDMYGYSTTVICLGSCFDEPAVAFRPHVGAKSVLQESEAGNGGARRFDHNFGGSATVAPWLV